MIDPSNFPDGLFSGGGMLAFAWAVWKTQQKMGRQLEQMLERLVRIDERTYERAGTAPVVNDLRPRRAKNQTPITHNEEDTKP